MYEIAYIIWTSYCVKRAHPALGHHPVTAASYFDGLIQPESTLWPMQCGKTVCIEVRAGNEPLALH